MLSKDKWFYFVGGRSASSIEDLKDALASIDDPEFVFHVNSGKNDFANWIEFVFKDPELARQVRRVQEKKDLLMLLEKNIEENSGSMKEPFEPTKFYLPKDFAQDLAPPQKPKELVLPMFETEHPSQTYGDERSLSNNEIKKIVQEAEHELHHTKHHRPHHDSVEPDHNFSHEIEEPETIKEAVIDSPPKQKHEDHRFIVKEFIYGFIVGLIFGLIMLGVIFQLNCPGGLSL